MRSQLVISCLISVGLLGPLAAAAATIRTTVSDAYASRTVSFSDLNLESHAGISRLYERIRSAAKEVCEPGYFRSTDSLLLQRQCAGRAIEQAVADVGLPQLTTFHMSLTSQLAAMQR